jgi:transposase
MKTRCGHPRKLSDRQIRKVMKWHQEAIEFRRAHGTHRDLARLLGVSLHAVRGCFESKIPHAPKSRARRGRPRHLDADQIAFVLAWRRVAWQFQARHGSIPGLARKLGVGASTIHDCVRRKGRYIQFAHVDGYQAHTSRRVHAPLSDNAVRSTLLRAWRRACLKSSRAPVKRRGASYV